MISVLILILKYGRESERVRDGLPGRGRETDFQGEGERRTSRVRGGNRQRVRERDERYERDGHVKGY